MGIAERADPPLLWAVAEAFFQGTCVGYDWAREWRDLCRGGEQVTIGEVTLRYPFKRSESDFWRTHKHDEWLQALFQWAQAPVTSDDFDNKVQEDRMAAADAILECKATETDTLSLSYLTLCPPGLGELSYLKELDLSFNDFDELCPGFEALKLLETFTLTGTRLKEIAVIPSLTRLQRLTITADIEELPPGFTSLINMRWLSLHCRSLKRLPDSFGNLTELIELNIEGQVETLPASCRAMTKLTGVCLGSKFREVPSCFEGLWALESIYMHGNLIEEVPDFLANLPHLHSLILSNNRIKKVPVSFGSALKRLCLKGNPDLLPPAESVAS